MLICVTLGFVFIYNGAYILTVNTNNSLSFLDLRTITIGSILPAIFFAVTQGASGEETGWRGFLQRRFEAQNGGKVIRAALKVALIWFF